MKGSALTRSIHGLVINTKKNSPHIFFTAGIIGSVASTILACRATMKLQPILDKMSDDIDTLDGDVHHTDDEYVEMYKWVWVDGAWEITKLYAPAVLVHILAVAALSGSHVQMARRNGALVATLVAANQSFKSYRDRIGEEIGEEQEAEIYNHVDRGLVDPSQFNKFTRIFNEDASGWHHDMEINRNFLHFCQDLSNELLHRKGVVFLNEIYDMLGFPHTREGMIYGWILGGEGDDFIDFGLMEAVNSRFINGLEKSVVLTFNVDGVLSDYI